jgi:hypothetical protein
MGMGSSGGTTKTEVIQSPEQREALREQTKFLTETAFPAYRQILGQAGDVFGKVYSPVNEAAGNAGNVAGRVGAELERQGAGSYGTGLSGLKALFDPNYKAQQVEAALQKGREDIREQFGSQNTMFGGAGGLGSSRMALADKNLRQLGKQRQQTAAAAAAAGVEANRATAAQKLAEFGQQGLTGSTGQAGSRIGFAGAPQDVFNKYASVIFGVPQANTTPNFAGTQGSSTTGESQSKGFAL